MSKTVTLSVILQSESMSSKHIFHTPMRYHYTKSLTSFRMAVGQVVLSLPPRAQSLMSLYDLASRHMSAKTSHPPSSFTFSLYPFQFSTCTETVSLTESRKAPMICARIRHHMFLSCLKKKQTRCCPQPLQRFPQAFSFPRH